MSGNCPRVVGLALASSTSCDCARPCSSKWQEDFGTQLKQLSREELEIEFCNLHTKNECLSKALKDNVKQMKRLNRTIKKNEEDRRRCLSPTKQLYEDRISQLEQSNHFLQDKVLVLRHQLQSHSRLHAKAHRNSSHHSRSINSTKTSQTHLSHLPIPDSENINQDEKIDLNEGLNVDLVENDNRILQLQSELDENPGDAARVAENIELIRLRRLVKRQSAQLATLNAHLEVSDKELEQLRTSYDQASLENDQVLKQLMNEKQRMREMQTELIELGNLKQDIKILQEQVRDLLSERSLLRSNNDKLLEIASGKTEEDNSQQQKNVTDKETVEQESTKEEAEKISFETEKETWTNCTNDQISRILGDSEKFQVTKKSPRISLKYYLLKDLIAKAFVANTCDLDIKPCTELSLLKAFTHQASDIFSKQFFQPSTLSYTVMPLTVVSDDNSIQDKDDEKEKGDKNDGNSPKVDDDGNDKRNEKSNNSVLSIDDAKFVFMQLLKHELENYDTASDQLMSNDRPINEEINLERNNSNGINTAENTHHSPSIRRPSSMVDYFWGLVGYKIFFPDKPKTSVEISEHSGDASSDNVENNEPNSSNDKASPLHTMTISDESFEATNYMESCILSISNVDNTHYNSDSEVNNNEPRLDISNSGSEESQTIEITSFQTIYSDQPHTSEDEFMPNQIESESQTGGDLSSKLAGVTVSNEKSSISSDDSEKSKAMLQPVERGEVEDSDLIPNLSRTSTHEENKNTTAGNEKSKAMFQPVKKGEVEDSDLIPNLSRTSTHEENKNTTAGNDCGSELIVRNVGNDCNQCSCNSSPGAGRYVLEEHTSGSSKNEILSMGDDFQNLPDQQTTTFIVYNFNSVTGLKNKIGVLFLKKMNNCECNAKSVPENQTCHNNQPRTPTPNDENKSQYTTSNNDNESPYTHSNNEYQTSSTTPHDFGVNKASDNQTVNSKQSEESQLSNRELEHVITGGSLDQKTPNYNQNNESLTRTVDNSVPPTILTGFDPTPLLTLLRRLIHKIVGDSSVNVNPGPSFSVDNNIVNESLDTNNPENVPQSFDDNACNSKLENHCEMSDIVRSNRRSLEPTSSASNSLDRNRQSSLSNQNKYFQRLSDPGLPQLDTKSKETQTYNRKSTVKNDKIDYRYFADSDQNSKKLSGYSKQRNSNYPPANSSRSLSRSPDKRTGQTLNDKKQGKSSQVGKTYPPFSDRLSRSVVGQDLGKNFELKKQSTPETLDSTSRYRTKQDYCNRPVSSNYHARCKTPANYSPEGQRSHAPKIIQSPLNKSKGCDVDSDEACKRNCGQKDDHIPKCESPISMFSCPHERELIDQIKRLLELLKQNSFLNENQSVSGFSNDDSESFYCDRRMAFSIPKDNDCASGFSKDENEFCSSMDDDGISSPQCCKQMSPISNDKDDNSQFSSDQNNPFRSMEFSIPKDNDRISSSSQMSTRINEQDNSQLSSDLNNPQKCPTCLNRKLRLQQLSVSNDSPFNRNQENDDQNKEKDQADHTHKAEKPEERNHQLRSQHPEMIIVVGKKLTIYESDSAINKK